MDLWRHNNLFLFCDKSYLPVVILLGWGVGIEGWGLFNVCCVCECESLLLNHAALTTQYESLSVQFQWCDSFFVILGTKYSLRRISNVSYGDRLDR